MRFGVMVTNGPGGHPPWKHAEVTASKLVIDPLPENDPQGIKTEAAETLRYKTRLMLEAHHTKVKDHELGQLKKLGGARLAHPLEPEDQHVEDALREFLALTKGTVLESHYARKEVQDAARHELRHEFRTQQHIHRNEHAAKGN